MNYTIEPLPSVQICSLNKNKLYMGYVYSPYTNCVWNMCVFFLYIYSTRSLYLLKFYMVFMCLHYMFVFT